MVDAAGARRLVCCLGALLSGYLLAGCQQISMEGMETAVPPSCETVPAQLFLPITQSLPAGVIAATATHPTPPAAAPHSCDTPGQIVESSLVSQWAGVFNYRVYFPPCYGENGRSYPTLYLLPGNIHTDSIWQDLGLPKVADTQMLSGVLPPFLIVMADGGWLAQNSSGGSGSFESVILDELIPVVEATTCAWPAPQGRAIGGLSRGGYWALEIAFRHPGAFAGVGGHSAALVDSYAWPEVNPRYTGLSLPPGALHIYLDIGQHDYLRPPLQELHENLASRQIAHTWVLNAGSHEEAYWAVNIPRYLAWYASLWPFTAFELPPCAK